MSNFINSSGDFCLSVNISKNFQYEAMQHILQNVLHCKRVEIGVYDIKFSLEDIHKICLDLNPNKYFIDKERQFYLYDSILVETFFSKIYIYGDSILVDDIKTHIIQKNIAIGNHPDEKAHHVLYKYMDSNGRDIRANCVKMSSGSKFFEEAYPYIEGGAYKKMDDFYNSDSSILILLGPPGTGKTSFIREYIKRHTPIQSSPYIVFDERVAADESLYLDFLISNSELIVFEDADNLMSDRILDNNKHMNKILNLSNGLLDIGKKKFIFSANLTDLNSVDHALTRPGRCFDTIITRALTTEEIQKINPNYKYDGAVTIAEIGRQSQSNAPIKKHKIGFK